MNQLFSLSQLAIAAAHHAAEHEEHINAFQLGGQAFTFLVFFVGLIYVARKPVSKYFLNRHEAVKAAVNEAQKAKAEALEKAREYETKMKDLDAELDKLAATFKGSAQVEKERLLRDAEEAAKKVQKDAEVAITAELEKARAQLREDAADLAVKLAEDILMREIKPDDHKRLVDDFMKTLTQGVKQKAA